MWFWNVFSAPLGENSVEPAGPREVSPCGVEGLYYWEGRASTVLKGMEYNLV